MAITEDDKRFISSRLVFSLAGIFLAMVAAALIGAYVLSRALVAEGALPQGPTRGVVAAGLDTPIVLIGGSLSFKAGSQKGTSQWTPVSGCGNPCTEYFIDPGYPVSTIALKAYTDDDGTDAPNPNDNNPTKDKIRADISNTSNWEIDEYATVNSVETQVASIKPNGATTEIHVKLVASPGILCPNKSGKRIMFGINGPCPASGPVTDPVTFTKVTLQIDNGTGVNTASGSLSCVDDSAKANPKYCRIVFRGSSN